MLKLFRNVLKHSNALAELNVKNAYKYKYKTDKRFRYSLKRNDSNIIYLKKNNSEYQTIFESDFFEINFSLNNTILKREMPYIWLRDNCKCSKCFNNYTEEVELDKVSLNVDSRPKNIQETAQDQSEKVQTHVEIICKNRIYITVFNLDYIIMFLIIIIIIIII
jgi:hypothetical protein